MAGMAGAHPQRDTHTEAAAVFGVEHMDGDYGTVVQGCPPAVLDEDGVIPAGAFCLLADHVVGGSISRLLDEHERMVTSHMHLEFVHRPKADLAAFVGRSTAVDLVPNSAFCTGTASSPSGVLLARFSSRFVLFSGGEAAGGVVTDEVPPPIPTAPPVAHEWTTAPIHQVLGTEIATVERGRVRLTMRAGKHLSNERDGIHGGVGGVMGDRASELAIRSHTGGPHRYRPVEMRVLFVRPIAASGALLPVEAEVGFIGRTTATTTARIYRPDGKLAIQVDSVSTVL